VLGRSACARASRLWYCLVGRIAGEMAVLLGGMDSFSRSLELLKGKGRIRRQGTFYAVAQGMDVEGGGCEGGR